MPFPNYRDKHAKKALFSAQDYLVYLKRRGRGVKVRPPVGVILCYQRSLLKHILDTHRTTEAAGSIRGLHLLEETGGQVGVMGSFGIGAPAAVTVLEELIAMDVKKFISVGSAGTLQKDIGIGDLVVCDKAIRDEGTSYHYLKPAKYAHASATITDRITRALDDLKQEYRIGISWTIDAPYRETKAEVRQYQKQGVATVEMEAAALFAVAQYRKVEMGAMFSVSDSLADLEWKPKFHLKRTSQGLETLYKAALAALWN
jgi:uridine phosphorylase